MQDRTGEFEVDGLRVVALQSISTANRYIVLLGPNGGDGYLEVVITWRDMADAAGQNRTAEAIHDWLVQKIRAVVVDSDRVVNYPPGKGPAIRKEPADA